MPDPVDYFQIEAAERLVRLRNGLLAWEASPTSTAVVEDLFREAHSLKGAAGVTGIADVATICHGMEDLLSRVRDGNLESDAQLIDTLLAATDALDELVAAAVAKTPADVDVAAFSAKLANHPTSRNAPEHVVEPPAISGPESDTAARDIAVQGTDTCDLSDTSERAPTTEESLPANNAQHETVRLHVSMLDELSSLSGELIVAGDRMRQWHGALGQLRSMVRAESLRCQRHAEAESPIQNVEAMVSKLVEDLAMDFATIEPLIDEIHTRVLDTCMLPLGHLFDQLPRFVRDYCAKRHKQASLRIEGANTRVDRRVLEQLRDPIIHLLRNALAHGIELPADREAAGKAPAGTIRLRSWRSGDRVCVSCEDDGRGIDPEQVLAAAVSDHFISQTEAGNLSAEQVLRLLLLPGFSTSPGVDDVSGRGVGLDAVAKRIETLGGALTIESRANQYTRFVLEFAATLATLDGLIVQDRQHNYIFPTSSVARTIRVLMNDLHTGGGGDCFVEIDDHPVPFVRLAGLLGHAQPEQEPTYLNAVVVRFNQGLVAISVDTLCSTQTVVSKGLGSHIRSAEGVIGATILGSGEPALILDADALLHAAGAAGARFIVPSSTVDVPDAAKVLVVDDSITTRMMEHSILESVGYDVDMAVSAEDALDKSRIRDYELFVVDVEMPGLNGFQLTRRLRATDQYTDTPIIMVTSLASDEHRREGMESGANAYIVKGEFDQNDLVGAASRLIGQ